MQQHVTPCAPTSVQVLLHRAPLFSVADGIDGAMLLPALLEDNPSKTNANQSLKDTTNTIHSWPIL